MFAKRSRFPFPSTNTGVRDCWNSARHANVPDPFGRPRFDDLDDSGTSHRTNQVYAAGVGF